MMQYQQGTRLHVLRKSLFTEDQISEAEVLTLVQIRECQCPACLQSKDHPDWQLHRQMNMLLGILDEQQRRWFAAMESKKIGRGGDTLLSKITGLDVETIRRGRRELDNELVERPINRTRAVGGGRPPLRKKDLAGH